MDPPSSAVSHEALQRQAYLLWEAAGFPPGQSEHFWLMAEQQLAQASSSEPKVVAPAPVRKSAKRKTPTASTVAAEAAPVHPTRRKPAAKSATKAGATPPGPQPVAKSTTPPAAKSPAKTAASPAAKPSRKTAIPAPPEPAGPVAKLPTKTRKPKSGDAS